MGSRGLVGKKGSRGVQGSTGQAGSRGVQGEKGDPGVEFDVLEQLCRYVTIPVVEQYRQGAYLRYALNSKKDIVMHHDGTHVEAIIDKGRHCNACQRDVGRMATLSSTRVLDNYVLDFQDDAYTMRGTGMGGFQYFCVFLVYTIKAYTRVEGEHERNYLISDWTGKKDNNRYRGICFLGDGKTLRIHGSQDVGSKYVFDIRTWPKTNPCEEGRIQVMCIEYVEAPKSSYSALWLNGRHGTSFDSTPSYGSDITLGNIRDGGVIPFLGSIAAMEVYTSDEGVHDAIKKAIMKTLCRDYKVDVD